jgi:hypothetical protein
MAYVCGSLCTENEVQLTKIVCMVALDEVNLLVINPSTYFVSQKIGVGSDTPRNRNNFRFYKRQQIRIYTIFWFC